MTEADRERDRPSRWHAFVRFSAIFSGCLGTLLLLGGIVGIVAGWVMNDASLLESSLRTLAGSAALLFAYLGFVQTHNAKPQPDV